MLLAFAARHYSHDANRFIYQASLSFADPGSKSVSPLLDTSWMSFPFCFNIAISSAELPQPASIRKAKIRRATLYPDYPPAHD